MRDSDSAPGNQDREAFHRLTDLAIWGIAGLRDPLLLTRSQWDS